MLFDPSGEPIVTEEKVASELIEGLITDVNKHYPQNGDARLRIYDSIAESLAGMVSALRGPGLAEQVKREADEPNS